MAIFNCYVSSPEGTLNISIPWIVDMVQHVSYQETQFNGNTTRDGLEIHEVFDLTWYSLGPRTCGAVIAFRGVCWGSGVCGPWLYQSSVSVIKVFYPPVIKGGNGKSPFKLRFEFGKSKNKLYYIYIYYIYIYYIYIYIIYIYYIYIIYIYKDNWGIFTCQVWFPEGKCWFHFIALLFFPRKIILEIHHQPPFTCSQSRLQQSTWWTKDKGGTVAFNQLRIMELPLLVQPIQWASGSVSWWCSWWLPMPSGKLLHSYGKSPFSMGKSTINGDVQ